MDMKIMVDAELLMKWQDTLTENDSLTSEKLDCNIGQSPFPYNASLNRRISFWVGNIWHLKSDAIICCKNEEIKSDLITQYTLAKAGKELKKEYEQVVKQCKHGVVKITKGYNLPSPFIIHTVSPKYSPKYFTAAETALHNSYRKVLLAAEENNFCTVGIRCIHSSVNKYPSFSGAHVALRTIRRFLEQHSTIKLVVLVVSNHNKQAYEALLPLYFPRSQQEEQVATLKLPSNTGDQNGQLFLPERQIRINPRLAKHNTTTTQEDSEDTNNISLNSNELKTPDIDRSFMVAKESVDRERVRRVARGVDPQHPRDLRDVLYKRLLIRAHKEDFTSLINKRFLYPSGKDRSGNRLVVFLAQRWIDDLLPQLFHPAASDDLSRTLREKMQLFFIHQLDAITNHPYSFLYVQALGVKDQPSSSCLQSLLAVLDSKYLTNLQNLYILHSTKLLSRWRILYRHPSALNHKTTFLKGLEHLWSFVSPDQLDLPHFVLANDLHLHGVRYHNS